MSAVVGTRGVDGKVYMGSDSLSQRGEVVATIDNPKVFIRDDMLFGFVGDIREGQLLQYKLEIPEPETDDVMAYMVGQFVEAVRDCLRDGGYMAIKDNEETISPFLVGYKGRLFEIDALCQVVERADGFMAIGSGANFCLASLYATRENDDSMQRVFLALKAAAHFSPYVGRPFVCLSISNEEKEGKWDSLMKN